MKRKAGKWRAMYWYNDSSKGPELFSQSWNGRDDIQYRIGNRRVGRRVWWTAVGKARAYSILGPVECPFQKYLRK